MAKAGVSFDLNFAEEITRATASLQSTPKQLEKATQRAIKKTMRWLSTRVAREMGQALKVPKKALDNRLTMTVVGKGGEQAHILWLGYAPLAAAKLGRARQTRRGVSVGKHRYQGAFYKDVYGDGDASVWIRKSRAEALGLELPRFSRKGKSRAAGPTGANKGRFPIMRVGVEVEQIAEKIFSRYQRRAMAQFSKIIDSELNYVVMHERK